MAQASGKFHDIPCRLGQLGMNGLVGLICMLVVCGAVVLTKSDQLLFGPGGVRQAMSELPMPPDGRPLALWAATGPGKPLAEGEVAVTYLSQGDLAVERLGGIIAVKRFVVKGKLKQVVFFNSPHRGTVFNWSSLIAYNSSPSIPESTVIDELYNHYDPELEGVKYEMRKTSIVDSYRTLLGREPSEDELLAGLDDCTCGVSVEEFEKRLAQSRAACEMALARAGGMEPSGPWGWLTKQRRIAQVLAGDLSLEDLAGFSLHSAE